MSILKTTTVAALLTIASTGLAQADTFTLYGEVEGWKVFADETKKSCLIEAKDSAENVVQMGLTADRGVGYLGVFVKGETDFKNGDTEAVAILIGENLYVGEATAMKGNLSNEYSGGYILSDDPQFVTDIAQQYVMTVFPEKDYGFSIDLTGTKKAIELARECNAKQLG
jgi:hypothetical protein